MMNRRKIEERIKRKEQEIQELEAKLRESRAYVQALQDVVKMFPREKGAESESSGEPELREGSMVAEARAVLLKEGRPMHISDLLRGLGKEVNKKTRASLSGSLAAYVRRGEIFTRPAPNTFGLVEVDSAGEADPQLDLPDSFGTEGDDSHQDF